MLLDPDEFEFSREERSAFPPPVHRDVGSSSETRQRLPLWRKARPSQMENIMSGRVMMILATAVLAGSLLATGAQARGGGGGGGGHGGGMGGFGGGHMGGFDGGRIGGLGGDHTGGLDGDRIGGLDGDHVGSLGGGHMARLDHDHLGAGRRQFGGGYYGYGLDCPYYPNYSSLNRPDTCSY
jgi:hypothetical protein